MGLMFCTFTSGLLTSSPRCSRHLAACRSWVQCTQLPTHCTCKRTPSWVLRHCQPVISCSGHGGGPSCAKPRPTRTGNAIDLLGFHEPSSRNFVKPTV